MDFTLLIGMAKWFILRQIAKYVGEIDWNKVADDFVDRIGKMVPGDVYADNVRLDLKAFMVNFGNTYESRGLASLYGTQGYAAAFESCFGDTDAAKLSAGQGAYIASVKPVKKVEVAEVKPGKEEKGGFLGSKKGGSKKT